jgi:hypothetical protein
VRSAQPAEESPDEMTALLPPALSASRSALPAPTLALSVSDVSTLILKGAQ